MDFGGGVLPSLGLCTFRCLGKGVSGGREPQGQSLWLGSEINPMDGAGAKGWGWGRRVIQLTDTTKDSYCLKLRGSPSPLPMERKGEKSKAGVGCRCEH